MVYAVTSGFCHSLCIHVNMLWTCDQCEHEPLIISVCTWVFICPYFVQGIIRQCWQGIIRQCWLCVVRNCLCMHVDNCVCVCVCVWSVLQFEQESLCLRHCVWLTMCPIWEGTTLRVDIIVCLYPNVSLRHVYHCHCVHVSVSLSE